MTRLARLLRHAFFPPWWLHVHFPKRTLTAVEAAVRESETRHRGEIRFAIETTLALGDVLRGVSPRERAEEVFSRLRVWDTEENNGVLIYLLLAERDVEIVADRGIAARVPAEDWQAVCACMEEAFRRGDFEGGAVAGVRAVSELLSRHFPATGPRPSALPDRPVVL